MDGFDELSKKLKDMAVAAKELEKTTSVSFEDLFTHSFMNENTTFKSFEDLLAAGNFKAETNDEFEAIPEQELDHHVSKTTNFTDWQDMLSSAGQEFAAKKLGF